MRDFMRVNKDCIWEFGNAFDSQGKGRSAQVMSDRDCTLNLPESESRHARIARISNTRPQTR